MSQRALENYSSRYLLLSTFLSHLLRSKDAVVAMSGQNPIPGAVPPNNFVPQPPASSPAPAPAASGNSGSGSGTSMSNQNLNQIVGSLAFSSRRCTCSMILLLLFGAIPLLVHRRCFPCCYQTTTGQNSRSETLFSVFFPLRTAVSHPGAHFRFNDLKFRVLTIIHSPLTGQSCPVLLQTQTSIIYIHSQTRQKRLNCQSARWLLITRKRGTCQHC